MKTPITLLLSLLLVSAQAQHVRFSKPETQVPDHAIFKIIGQVNDHFLILLDGGSGAEIAIYDEGMKKIRSVPAGLPKTGLIGTDIFAFPDHVMLWYQYGIDTTYYVARIEFNGDGEVIKGATIMDSTVLPAKKIMTENGPVSTTNSFRPMFIVLRSENRKWFMILKGTSSQAGNQRMESTLFDQDLKPVERSLFTYSRGEDPGIFSEFILDNDGDLAFTHSVIEDEDSHKVIQAKFAFKAHGSDSLVSTELAIPDRILERIVIRADNANHRFILNTFYYDWKSPHLNGLCSMIWEKDSRSMASTVITPIPIDILADARSDLSPPDQVLDHYHLRQVLPFSDGGYLVLAELIYGPDKFYKGPLKTSFYGNKRLDFIRGRGYELLTPTYRVIPFEPHELPVIWSPQVNKKIDSKGAYGADMNTDNLLVFFMDRQGRSSSIKVIHKSEYSTPGMWTISYFPFNDGKTINLLYNENIKGYWLPVGSSIKADGAIDLIPVLHSIGRDQVFFPRYGKQVGLRTAIVPCQIGEYLGFARVDFE